MTHVFVTWLTLEWHDSCIGDMTHSSIHASCRLLGDVTWLIRMWHDLFIRDITSSYVTWLMYLWRDSLLSDMTHVYVTWLMYIWLDAFLHSCFVSAFKGSDTTHVYVTWLIPSCMLRVGIKGTWHDPWNSLRAHSLGSFGSILCLFCAY